MAIKLYYALGVLMSKLGLDITPEQVLELVTRWLAGDLAALGEPAYDAATCWQMFQLWMRTDRGQAVQITGRIAPPDFTIIHVRPLTSPETEEFTQWEAHND